MTTTTHFSKIDESSACLSILSMTKSIAELSGADNRVNICRLSTVDMSALAATLSLGDIAAYRAFFSAVEIPLCILTAGRANWRGDASCNADSIVPKS